MLKSGVHATLAGVTLAIFIPMKSKTRIDYSPLKSMEHDLHFAVAYIILPIFAFANAGISFVGLGVEEIFHSVSIGVALGLFIGKQLGVFGLCWLAIKLKYHKFAKGYILEFAVWCSSSVRRGFYHEPFHWFAGI